VPFMFTCDWVFFGFIEEIAVNRLRLIVDLPNQNRFSYCNHCNLKLKL
jgi:hypothetical protein